MLRWMRLHLSASLALGLALLLAACGPTGASTTPTPTVAPTATPVPCAAWSVIPTPSTAQNRDYFFEAVAAVSPSEAWAVGYSVSRDNGQMTPLIEQWDGSVWRIVANPNAGEAGWLSSVAAVSSQDAWAVGWGSGSPLIERWDGTRWSVAPTPISSGEGTPTGLRSVVALSANDVWALGSISQGNGPMPATTVSLLALRWDGSAWRSVTAPAPAGGSWNVFNGAARIPGTNRLWAVGYTGSDLSEPLIEQWDGSAWRIVPSPAFPSGAMSGRLTAVTALSATDAWAAGQYDGSDGLTHSFFVHWDGTAWKVVSSPNIGDHKITGLVAVSATDARFVGTVETDQSGAYHPVIDRWNGSTWQTVEGPMPQGAWSAGLGAIATDGAGGYWAAGSYRQSSSDASQTLIARCS